MDEALVFVSKLATLVFIVASMSAAGLGLSVRELLVPLSRVRLVSASLVVNFLIAPALAYGLTKVFAVDVRYENGLLLLGAAAGAPFLPKLAEAARGDRAFAVGLMMILMVGSVVFMPLALPLMIPGLSADAWPILKPLLTTMLTPLMLGMLVRYRSERMATRLMPAVKIISSLSMWLAVLLLFGLNFQAMIGTIGTGAASVGVLFVILTFLTGYAFGGPAFETRNVLGVGSAQRNVAAALLVATQNFSDPAIVVMLLVTTFAGVIVLLIISRILVRTKTHTTLS